MNINNHNILPFSSIKPRGWLREQMLFDLEKGFVGHLDNLVPDLIIDDDIYGENRLTKKIKSKDVGIKNTGKEWEVQFLWWNSETQSNWWDGFIRNVLLTEHPTLRLRVDDYIKSKLYTQDNDGYIGIYDDDLRYQHQSENGELWAQATLFRGLLAYFEATNDNAVLNAVITAVEHTMMQYPIGKSFPFAMRDAVAGVGHGLMFTDVLEKLFQITNNIDYSDYATFLYADYDQHEQLETDIQTKSLNDPNYRFKGHGVHTYEHLRPLLIAATHSKNPTYLKSLENYLHKLESVLSPSGGPIGDEWIAQRDANPEGTGYEHCSIQELLHSYAMLLDKTGEAKWADKIEWLVFNAALGGRTPDKKSIAYCNTDTSYQMLGHLDMNQPQGEMRFKYSPSHKDVAVCCAPNAGRIFPYYVQSFASYSENGIVINLYGPCDIRATINDTKVKIRQETTYPSEFSITLTVECESPTQFVLSLRKPNWATKVSCKENLKEQHGYLVIDKCWETTSTFSIEFKAEPTIEKFANDKAYVRYGPLLFVQPIDFRQIVLKEHAVSGSDAKFYDYAFEAVNSQIPDYSISKDSTLALCKHSDIENHVVREFKDFELKALLHDNHTKTLHDCTLKPMAFSVLRKACFDLKDD